MTGRTPTLRVGTAGWSIARGLADHFAPDGTALERYASTFDCVEINSSFYRPHKPETYARWAASVPKTFRFSVKLPKIISHETKLALEDGELQRFAEAIGMLGETLGAVLVQLAPNHAFAPTIAEPFLAACKAHWRAHTAIEPRHASWFESDARALLAKYDIAVVGADPARPLAASQPLASNGLGYWRLHGSPKIYYSDYDDATIADYAARMRNLVAEEVWCIFDNTAAGAALKNALTLQKLLQGKTVR
ncbi:hypothetical protein VW35_01120 [Devosia soli]|uniref:DUF72 domain-containing protein n=1 Tax=Devosia soli TaxID=361041 RepID=A0A0F5LF57_9HYPH|nr:DUF72 domain-containing protein [Devosia soli]KKB80834.1 hypothetical protein VW35_01120 [Devosia soli]